MLIYRQKNDSHLQPIVAFRPIVLPGELRRLLFVAIDRLEERRERGTEGEATPAIVAVLEHAHELVVECGPV